MPCSQLQCSPPLRGWKVRSSAVTSSSTSGLRTGGSVRQWRESRRLEKLLSSGVVLGRKRVLEVVPGITKSPGEVVECEEGVLQGPGPLTGVPPGQVLEGGAMLEPECFP